MFFIVCAFVWHCTALLFSVLLCSALLCWQVRRVREEVRLNEVLAMDFDSARRLVQQAKDLLDSWSTEYFVMRKKIEDSGSDHRWYATSFNSIRTEALWCRSPPSISPSLAPAYKSVYQCALWNNLAVTLILILSRTQIHILHKYFQGVRSQASFW